jgi:hypothetical protein
VTEVVVADKLGAQIVERWTLPWPEIRMPHSEPCSCFGILSWSEPSGASRLR